MAPVRRYLRISSHSVLEVRIYVDNPADVHRWLLRAPQPALPRIIDAVRPLVLPKLREEIERSRKGGKRKGVKDTVKGDDFDVSVFLTELSSRHTIMLRHRHFAQKPSSALSGSRAQPVEIDDHAPDDATESEMQIRAESPDENVKLEDIPTTIDVDAQVDPDKATTPLRTGADAESDNAGEPSADNRPDEDDKKKLGVRTTYDGFQIHGRILCLIVTRTGAKAKPPAPGTGQARMEEWISSTQDLAGAV